MDDSFDQSSIGQSARLLCLGFWGSSLVLSSPVVVVEFNPNLGTFCGLAISCSLV